MCFCIQIVQLFMIVFLLHNPLSALSSAQKGVSLTMFLLNSDLMQTGVANWIGNCLPWIIWQKLCFWELWAEERLV